MVVELKVPEIGESITEVMIGEWIKTEGDYVERDEDVVVVESEKATVEISAPESGKLVKIFKRSGDTATVGEVIGRFESAEAGDSQKKEPPPIAKAVEAAETAEKENGAKAAEAREESAPGAREEKEEPGQESDAQERRAEPQAPAQWKGRSAGVEKKTDGAMPRPGPAEPINRAEKTVPMSPIRRRIAERLVQARQTTAFVSTFNEIDMSAVNAIRRQYQDEFQKKYNVRLGLMSFFVKASIEALKLIPQVNAEIRGTDIVYRNYYDIGVAVGGGKGLIVPVLRNAEKMSFAAVEQAIQEFARKAESGEIRPGDLEGGTFTISNGGVYGSLLSTPIINPPQSGILGMHAIQDRPVARDGQLAIRPMMYIALTYDHRIVDGREAVIFLKRIKECVEAPPRILLEI
jgi:2-oxoglutarate dehydrogenase E2 component (dihydrolipoamide succinyltransferase)